MSSRHQEPIGLQLWLLPMQVFPSFAFDGRYGKQYHTVFAQKPSSCCGSFIDIFKGGWGRGDHSSPSHSTIHALTPLLGVSTLTSSFSAVLFPPKNKCDTVLTLFSVSLKNPGRLGAYPSTSGWSHHFFQKTRVPSPREVLVVNAPCLFSFLSALLELPNLISLGILYLG